VTAFEPFDLTTQRGGADFARLIHNCELSGSYCLIGGLAVNAYVEPVYTLDADIVVVAECLPKLAEQLGGQGFRLEKQAHSVNAQA
jgi:hypothetical protein